MIFTSHLLSHFVSRDEGEIASMEVGKGFAESFSFSSFLSFSSTVFFFYYLDLRKVYCPRMVTWEISERGCVRACQSHLMHRTTPYLLSLFRFPFFSFFSFALNESQRNNHKEQWSQFWRNSQCLVWPNNPIGFTNFDLVSDVLRSSWSILPEYDLTFSCTLSNRCLRLLFLPGLALQMSLWFTFRAGTDFD